MAAYNKFNVFVEDLCSKVLDLFGTAGSTADTMKVMLTNTAPVATNVVKTDITDIAAGSGYTAGGATTANVGTRTTGTTTVQGTMVVFTAAGGSIGPFRYVVLYNDTVGAPVKPLVAWWDYGSALTLLDGETFSVKFNSSATQGDIFTLA